VDDDGDQRTITSWHLAPCTGMTHRHHRKALATCTTLEYRTATATESTIALHFDETLTMAA